MISRILRERANEDNTRIGEKQRGIPSALLRLSSHRTVETLIPNLSKLPCHVSAEVLQNADGTFVYLPGYSSDSGPDA